MSTVYSIILSIFYTIAVSTRDQGPLPCVSDCNRVPDGDYQSCLGCNVFATCTNGNLIDNRDCASNGNGSPLEWDDIEQRCIYESNTCGTQPSSGPCITSCSGLADGDYQSCQGCSVYATCSNGNMYDSRPCAPNDPPLVWDDSSKTCEFTSPTCVPPATTTSSPVTTPPHTSTSTSGNTNTNTGSSSTATIPTPGSCITSCAGLADGDYNSCQSCNVYASCVAGNIYDSRPCGSNGAGAPLEFDAGTGRCEFKSETCGAPSGSSGCITSCDGLENGHYQSCQGCNVYASCVWGSIIDSRPCSATTVWDDNKKSCEFTSPTCSGSGTQTTADIYHSGCMPTCGYYSEEGEFNFHSGYRGAGLYQSCDGCDVYLACCDRRACGTGIVRTCQAGTYFDATIGSCQSVSQTCTPGVGGASASGAFANNQLGNDNQHDADGSDGSVSVYVSKSFFLVSVIIFYNLL